MKEISIYQAKSGAIEFKGDFEKETILGTQRQIAELFDVNIRTINEHLQNIYKTKELSEKSTIRKFRIVQTEGKLFTGLLVNRRKTKYSVSRLKKIKKQAAKI